MTKKRYLGELRFFVSFYFTEDECNDIMSDYEDWFDNELSLGRNENEICEKMLSPRMLAKKLFVEAEKTDGKVVAFFRNRTVKTSLIVVIHMLLCTYTMMKSNTRGESYLYYGLGINLILDSVTLLIFAKNKGEGFKLSMRNLVNFILPAFFVFAVWIVLRNTSKHDVGVLYDSFFLVFMIIIYAYGIYLALTNRCNQCSIASLVFVFGFVVMIGFSRNQLHVFYSNPSGYVEFLRGNVFLYVEMLLFQVLFWVKGKWIHN